MVPIFKSSESEREKTRMNLQTEDVAYFRLNTRRAAEGRKVVTSRGGEPAVRAAQGVVASCQLQGALARHRVGQLTVRGERVRRAPEQTAVSLRSTGGREVSRDGSVELWSRLLLNVPQSCLEDTGEGDTMGTKLPKAQRRRDSSEQRHHVKRYLTEDLQNNNGANMRTSSQSERRGVCVCV
ncbi:hypothetical protein EYF80_058935 [Liparis tanakae]|uniref:Uncharacterized protein n=1 Tax=Liparis tanakae TaxID=230148 RepID=A0A4Z2ERJ2_9TELE|nr:hypothetical protein EYF80_058935 [Liparis tanakae]